MARAPRTSRGRRKIKMAKITKEPNRIATFSKHRFTVDRSASELCTLTGAEVALFSPGNKVCSFGSPDVHSIIDRHLSNGLEINRNSMDQLHNMAVSKNLNEEFMHLKKVLEQEKERAQILDNTINERKGKYWWDDSIEMLDLNQLEQRMRLGNICTMIESRVPQNGIFPTLNLNGSGASSSSTIPQGFQTGYLCLPPPPPTTNFGVSQQPSSASTMGASSSNHQMRANWSSQMDVSTAHVVASSTNVDQMAVSTHVASNDEKESATVGVLKPAGPSRINIDRAEPLFGHDPNDDGDNANDDDYDWLKRLLAQL